jgi:glycosyltransferase involved in cell wall biosynthesis
MALDFTIAIPTYNAERRLDKLLDSLQLQVGLDHLTWEVLVVDNNSTDHTAQVVQNYQRRLNLRYLLRYYFEPRQGAAFARQRAVGEAQSELIGFLDDDNLPAPDWIAQALTFGKNYPQAAAFGGQVHGAFEVKPPVGFEGIKQFLAIQELGDAPLKFQPENIILPVGAALVVRRQAWRKHVRATTLSGKVQGRFVQGDEFEPLLYLFRGGWEIWYNPKMHTYHQIPRQRFEREHLMILSKGCGLAICQLRMINANEGQHFIIIIRTILGGLRRIIRHLLKCGWRNLTLDAAVEREFYWGILLSPLYLKKLPR